MYKQIVDAVANVCVYIYWNMLFSFRALSMLNLHIPYVVNMYPGQL